MFQTVVGDSAMEEQNKRKRMLEDKKHSSTLQLTMFHFLEIYVSATPDFKDVSIKHIFARLIAFAFVLGCS